jgi:lipid A ethanolaminephosphotransferase
MPYSMAPREQTHVPMLLWMSEAMRTQSGLDLACLQDKARQPASHDHVFHTMLGLNRISTRAYEAQLDMTAGCRPASIKAASS